MMGLLFRLLDWLLGTAPSNADGLALNEIGGLGEVNVDSITLRVGQAPRSFRVVPNKGDVTVESVITTIDGSATGSGSIGLAPYVSEPGNPLAFTLTPLSAGSGLFGYSFDSDTDGGVQTVSGSVPVTVLPENADAATVEEIV